MFANCQANPSFKENVTKCMSSHLANQRPVSLRPLDLIFRVHNRNQIANLAHHRASLVHHRASLAHQIANLAHHSASLAHHRASLTHHRAPLTHYNQQSLSSNNQPTSLTFFHRLPQLVFGCTLFKRIGQMDMTSADIPK